MSDQESAMPIETHLDQLRVGLAEYRAGRLPLHALVSHLESHLLALKKTADEFTHAFSDAWLELETANALNLAAGERRVSPVVSRDRVNQTIAKLEALLSKSSLSPVW